MGSFHLVVQHLIQLLIKFAQSMLFFRIRTFYIIQSIAYQIFLTILRKIGPYDIVGVVGRRATAKERMGNIKQGSDKKRAVRGKVVGIEKCDTVDECFFGGYTECFQRYPFSETLCEGWHMYAVERCLAALKRGDNVFVVDADLTHISGGKIDHAYNITFYKISKQYKSTVKCLATTCEDAPTAVGSGSYIISRENFM